MKTNLLNQLDPAKCPKTFAKLNSLIAGKPNGKFSRGIWNSIEYKKADGKLVHRVLLTPQGLLVSNHIDSDYGF